jgi:hypothetical protein
MPAISLAYKFVATAVMLLEANHCASRLELPVTIPITEQDVRVMVSPPRVMGFAGRIDTTNFSFSFARSGRLSYITRLEEGYQAYSTTKAQGQMPTSEFLLLLTNITSRIGTNEAYHLASNWLARLEVDVSRLERDHRPKVGQHSSRGRGLLPIFFVNWGGEPGDRLGTAVSVMLSGDTQDLLYLRQEDISYSKRPASLIMDMEKLLAIPDDEFLKYSPLERSNLVARFAAVEYPLPAKRGKELRK